MKNPYNILTIEGMKVAYMKFDKPPKTPYLIYYGSGSNNFKADNKVFNSENTYIVEYYNNRKDEKEELKIEKIFDDNEILWEKSEDIYIEKEDLFLIRYYLGG
ncbi:MAG: hypothetical protein SOR77_00725 [Peptoniphilus sp.]|uniref:hypothetical protein n=1 Tax=Peptoniphilus sp. TaxID=1971214 RepID=UPI002A751D30|nr:hypothetical protein [Peptoniphilus sp.]MDY2986133.1 hypothetical protein [Peptoniphilus sp.]